MVLGFRVPESRENHIPFNVFQMGSTSSLQMLTIWITYLTICLGGMWSPSLNLGKRNQNDVPINWKSDLEMYDMKKVPIRGYQNSWKCCIFWFFGLSAKTVDEQRLTIVPSCWKFFVDTFSYEILHSRIKTGDLVREVLRTPLSFRSPKLPCVEWG